MAGRCRGGHGWMLQHFALWAARFNVVLRMLWWGRTAALVLSGLHKIQLFCHGRLSPWALTPFAGCSSWVPTRRPGLSSLQQAACPSSILPTAPTHVKLDLSLI